MHQFVLIFEHMTALTLLSCAHHCYISSSFMSCINAFLTKFAAVHKFSILSIFEHCFSFSSIRFLANNVLTTFFMICRLSNCTCSCCLFLLYRHMLWFTTVLSGDEPITLFENRSDFFQFWLPADPIRSPKSDHHSDPIFNPIQSFSRSDHHADLIFNPIQSFSRFDHQNLPFLTEFGPLR